MTYVVTDNCIKYKYTNCVEVCPVDCFYEGENMLVSHPDERIDCGVRVSECPAEAIFPDTDPSATPAQLALNHEFASVWPNITRKKAPPDDADGWNGVPGKFDAWFSNKAGGRVTIMAFQLRVSTNPVPAPGSNNAASETAAYMKGTLNG